MSFENIAADLWRDEDNTSPAIGFGGREKVVWQTPKMSKYFESRLFEAKWHKGFVSVNHGALQRHFRNWRDRGKTEEEVRTLIDRYMTDESARGKYPGWSDFLFRAEQIAATVAPVPAQKSREELLDEAYEIGTLEAFQAAFPGSPRRAQEYYDNHREELDE